MWSSTQRQKCGHLLTDTNVVNCSQTKVWSSAHRKSVVICSQTRVWLHGTQTKLWLPATDIKEWSSAKKTKVCGRRPLFLPHYAWTWVTKGSAKYIERLSEPRRLVVAGWLSWPLDGAGWPSTLPPPAGLHSTNSVICKCG